MRKKNQKIKKKLRKLRKKLQVEWKGKICEWFFQILHMPEISTRGKNQVGEFLDGKKWNQL